MDFNLITGWASIISLLLGVFSICFSTFSLKKVNRLTNKSTDTNRNKMKVDGIGNTTVGRDYNDK
ncbi:hypothetical protein NSQ43_05895 [Sporosarcina sp. FSL W8-0480]|uniref:hypothetical protein n=1 Tax=Sporosarcina sp. FSL W8-0480 TaxID=2954701 RepID=UPI0030DD08D2